ncbi:MAG: bifunctional UDP-sugar hydrolase/5'-nucleotidase [Planctomycetota bacterium]|nr:bifunctional UDP-sugar hydrolase/5'-nucleotidase [Planctomycetota bacterium]
MRAPSRRLGLLILPALALVLAFACGTSPAAPETLAGSIHLVVLHTNDVHGQALPRRATWIDREDPPLVGGLPRLAAEIERIRAETSGANEAVLVLDGGDWFQGTPEGRFGMGAGFVAALKAVGYDAMCIGNHELDHGVSQLVQILDSVRPPAIVANLREPETGERLAWTKPWKVVRRAGLAIALVGLLTPETPEITHPDARSIAFEEPGRSLERALDEIRRELGGEADLVIPLTHLGLEADRELARAVPDLPLIVGGHSHTYLAEGVREGDTLIVQAGSKATVLGRVDLWIDPEDGTVLESSARLIDLDTEPVARNADVERLCAELVRRADENMDVVVGRLSASLEGARGLRSSTAGNLLADVFRERVGADVGLHNKGGIRTNLSAGDVTRRDLFQLLPFDNTLVVLDLSGEELFECVRRAVEGRSHSGLELSGMRVSVTGSGRLVSVEVGGRALDPDRTYRVATNSFLARGGDEYLDADGAYPMVDTGLLLRDVLEEVLRASPDPVDPPAENRYTVVDES